MGCCSSKIDPDDPTVRAYVLTNKYLRHGTAGGSRGTYSQFNYACPQAVYVRGNELHVDSCCMEGYPLSHVSSVEVIPEREGGSLVSIGDQKMSLNPGILIRGSDGTTIAFSASNPDVETFAQQLRSAMEMAKPPS